MNKPIRKRKDWTQATTGVCSCGKWAAILEGQCPECHDADHASEVEAYYQNRIYRLEQQNAALVEALQTVLDCGSVNDQWWVDKVKAALAHAESAEGE